MAKKKNVRAENITEGDILSLYRAVLPLVSHNPDGLHFPNVLKAALLKFVEIETFHYIVEDLTQDPSDIWNTYFENSVSKENKTEAENLKDFSRIALYSADTSSAEERFAIDVKYGY